MPTIKGKIICALVLNRLEPARKLRNVSHSLTKPLKSGSPAIEQQPTRTAAPVNGIRRCKPSQFVQIDRMSGIRNRAGAEKQQALEQSMVEGVQERSDKRQSRAKRGMMRQENERCPQPEKDDADVFHAAVSQQSLQVMLGNRIENAEKTRNRSHDQDDIAGPPGAASKKIKREAHKSVDRRLQHDPGHQRRDGTGCDGMGPGQP